MPKRTCSAPRCPNDAVAKGRCRAHARTREREIHPHKRIYDSKRWKILRRHVLHEQPICAVEGCERLAEHVDHIVDIDDAPELTWVRANLRGLCPPHHSQKTRASQMQ